MVDIVCFENDFSIGVVPFHWFIGEPVAWKISVLELPSSVRVGATHLDEVLGACSEFLVYEHAAPCGGIRTMKPHEARGRDALFIGMARGRISDARLQSHVVLDRRAMHVEKVRDRHGEPEVQEQAKRGQGYASRQAPCVDWEHVHWNSWGRRARARQAVWLSPGHLLC